MVTVSAPTPSADRAYEIRARAVLDQVEATIDAWLERDVVDIDVQRTGGLLELSLPGGSKIILNLQPPLQELWIAARSGGFHFKFDGECWVDSRSGREFFNVLSDCASAQAGMPLRFGKPAV